MENTKLLITGGGDSTKTELPDYGGAHSQTSNGVQKDVTQNTDSLPPECSVDELCSLMKLRGSEARDRLIADYGSVGSLCQRLRTHPDNGLNGDDDGDILRRQVKYGPNFIPTKSSRMFLFFIWEAIQDMTLIILVLAAIASLGLSFYRPPASEVEQGDPTEGRAGYIESIGIMIAVVIIVLVTAFINWSKDVQFRGLQKQLELQFRYSVIRSGHTLEVPVSDIVVGDICIVKYGDIIPADGVLISSNDLNVDESTHTGESDDVIKTVESDVILHSGTHVIEGNGKMVVTAVGVNSAKGVVYSLLGVTYDEDDKPTDKRSILHRKLVKIALQITYVGTALAFITLVILITRFSIDTFAIRMMPWQAGYIQDYVSFLIIAITILAVAVPEGLPLAVILSLAYSIRKMMHDKNLVRHLDACETMGNATTVCCDKTGTLTANRMTVVRGFIADQLCMSATDFGHLPSDVALLLGGAISVNSSYTNSVKADSWGVGYKYSSNGPIGNKTECALLSLVSVLGPSNPAYFELRRRTPETSFVKTYTFNSDRKWMATVVPAHGQPLVGRADTDVDIPRIPGIPGYRIYVKGAAEMVIRRCDRILGQGGLSEQLTTEKRKFLETEIIDKMASDGLRTMCIAYRDIYPGGAADEQDPNWDDEDSIVSGLVCIAIVGIEDPLRPEVAMAIQQCQSAGITVRMVTGDSVRTAMYVAKKCGILNDNEGGLVLDGTEFNRLVRRKPNEPIDQGLIDAVWPRLRVLARSSPEDKYNLVRGIMESRIHQDRQIVAVTGDGTNDAPALRKAHVGLAMGLAGTDVAKEASDIIIMDDNFASIVKAVVWGRHVYDSIAKFIQFQLTVNVVAVTLALIGACIITDSPLKGIQMLWVNLLMDTLASLSLATERPTDKLLDRKPYGFSEPIVSPLMLRNILSHAAYELTVLFVLLFVGENLIDVDSGRDKIFRGVPTIHYTVVFNAFVMMILFNEICARKLDTSPNVFAGIHRSPLFIAIWLASFIAQVLIVQFGGDVFFTVALSLDLWLWCLFIGISDLLFAEAVSGVVMAVSWLKSAKTSGCLERRPKSDNSADDISCSALEMQSIADNKPFYTSS